MSKVDELFDIVVNECYCDWGIFTENVENYETRASFKEKLNACETRDDIRKLVNQYI